MGIQRLVLSAGLVLLAAACLDGVAPRPAGAPTPHFLRWAPGIHPRFTTNGVTSTGGVSSGGGAIHLQLTSPLSLNRYSTSFWAVRGQTRSVEIDYLSATGDTSQPFLRFTATDPAVVPGVGDLAVGDSVLITLTVDSADIGVGLEPTGLQFGTPAELQIWYTGAGGDLNGDGVVDSTDATIEHQFLGVWYHEESVDPWTTITATHSVVDKTFTVSLPHFCEYAVSW
ncbi:MAG TPA: hypothetical protein VM716_14530 [Gemmatimonadales bacterium]|nr:hypothetical protein [Gemmatimonadales bacterium]